MSTLPQCQLQISMAASSPYALILRRGPRRWARMVLWDIMTDTFTLGQWINAPIRGFDISPDGKFALCFIQSYRKKDAYTPYVSLSKAPYFTALANWSIGDSWGGQCCFRGDKHIVIGKGLEPVRLIRGSLGDGYRWVEETPSYEERLNPGWHTHALPSQPLNPWKRDASQQYKIESMNGTFLLSTPDDTEKFSLSNMDCADFDHRNRLVYAQNGALYVAHLGESVMSPQLLMDFHTQQPQAIEAPAEAKVW